VLILESSNRNPPAPTSSYAYHHRGDTQVELPLEFYKKAAVKKTVLTSVLLTIIALPAAVSAEILWTAAIGQENLAATHSWWTTTKLQSTELSWEPGGCAFRVAKLHPSRINCLGS